jgi:hypothetical protein
MTISLMASHTHPFDDHLTYGIAHSYSHSMTISLVASHTHPPPAPFDDHIMHGIAHTYIPIRCPSHVWHRRHIHTFDAQRTCRDPFDVHLTYGIVHTYTHMRLHCPDQPGTPPPGTPHPSTLAWCPTVQRFPFSFLLFCFPFFSYCRTFAPFFVYIW